MTIQTLESIKKPQLAFFASPDSFSGKKKDNDTIFVNARSGEYIFLRFDID